MNGPTGRLYHHIGLYGYVVAWLAALVLAYKPIFRGTPTRSAPTSRRQLNPHASRASLPSHARVNASRARSEVRLLMPPRR